MGSTHVRQGRKQTRNPALLLPEAKRLLARNQPLQAYQLLRSAAKQQARNPEHARLMASAAVRAAEAHMLQTDVALQVARHALELRPADHRVLFWTAMAYKLIGDIESSIEHFERCHQLAPVSGDLLSAYANVLLLAGRHEQGRDILLPHYGPDAEYRIRWLYSEFALRLGDTTESLRVLEELTQDRSLTFDERRSSWFALSEFYERQKEYDKAIEAATEGHRFDRFDFDPDLYDQTLAHTMDIFSADGIARLPRSGNRSERPIFIVGLPRSGTTLLEQMLGQHPDIAPAGEQTHLALEVAGLQGAALRPTAPSLTNEAGITAGAIYKGGHNYLQHTKHFGPNARYITDKAPLNVFHLGPLNLMLPKCHVIHIRRDPRDNAVSYFLKRMVNVHPQSGSFEYLARYNNGIRTLMEHWKQVLDLPILEVRYEDLIVNTELETRRLLDFLDLPFDEACLRPHESDRTTVTASFEQVRKPINTAARGRWRRYEKHLQPFLETIDPRWIAEYDAS
jgi:hypothetical protein